MTVAEIMELLKDYPPDRNVYVPDSRDGTAQIVQQVVTLCHLNGIPGVTIPDDVALLPWKDDEREEEA